MEPNLIENHDQPSSPPPNAQPPAPGSARRHNAVVIVVIILVVTGMVVASKFLVKKQGTGPGLASSNVSGQLAPDFTLTSIDGKAVKLSDLRGKAVVLNFWATWCAPCKIEIPWFIELQKQYGTQGLEIVGVNMDDNPTIETIGKFAREQGIDYTVLLGNDKVADEYGGVEALPTTFYIGRDGKIVKRAFGLIGHGEIEQNIQAALKQGGEVAKR